MADYKKPNFKKSFSRSAPRRDFDGPKKLYKADCSNCGDVCEVPFRPNGMKPVFCRNCFQREEGRDARPARAGRDSYGARDFSPRPFSAPKAAAPDHRIDDLKRQLTMLESKLDNLTRLVEASTSFVEKKAPAKRAAKTKKA